MNCYAATVCQAKQRCKQVGNNREPMNAERGEESERLALTHRSLERRPSGPKYFLGACGATGTHRSELC